MERITPALMTAIQPSPTGTHLITDASLRTLFPSHPDISVWLDPLRRAAEAYAINTKLRTAAFLAQVGHESAGLTAVVENMNYSAEALTRTWPSRFPSSIAASYARQPEKIANRAYADRMGNGDELSGDGWRWRGRGLIQITGRNNYQAFAVSVGMPVNDVPGYAEKPAGAARTAGWFWSTNGLNELADAGDIDAISRRINGGDHGLKERRDLYRLALVTLS